MAACYNGREESVKILFASGRVIDTTATSEDGETLGANTAEIARADLQRRGKGEQIARLVEQYAENSTEVTHRLRKELGWASPAAKLFALTIFICDGLLEITLPSQPPPTK